jgi:predicted dehydrogenase
VCGALRAGKNVFVEKPLAMTGEELEQVREAYEAADGAARLMVGYNRRFAPLLRDLVAALPLDVPRAIQYRINAGLLPPEHWVHDPVAGGGRIIGEACHFIDLAMHVAGSPIVSVSAAAVPTSGRPHDTAAIALGFADGSIATISYYSTGSKQLPKEYLEVHAGGVSAVLDDFRELRIHGATGIRKKKAKQDKGHAEEISAFLQALRDGAPAPIPFEELHLTSRATFAVLESIRDRRMVHL